MLDNTSMLATEMLFTLDYSYLAGVLVGVDTVSCDNERCPDGCMSTRAHEPLIVVAFLAVEASMSGISLMV